MVKNVVEAVSEKAPGKPEADVVHPYAATDPIPVPEAVESDGDTAWALWENLTRPQEDERNGAFPNTAPKDLELAPLAKKPGPQ